MKHFLALLAILTALCGSQPLFAGPPPTPAPVSVLAGQTVLAVTSTTARVALPASLVVANTITIVNTGSKDVFFGQGASTVVATISGIKLGAGHALTIWAYGAYLAAITAGSDTSDLVIYQSNGPIYFQ